MTGARGREAILALADGTIFSGRAFGADRRGRRRGRVQHRDDRLSGGADRSVVPRTDRLHDVSGDRQRRNQCRGCRIAARSTSRDSIVKEYCAQPSNWRAEISLGEYLANSGVVGIEGIDTRALVRHIRTHGAQEAVISSADTRRGADWSRRPKSSPGLIGRDLVKEVTCAAAYDWDTGDWELGRGYRQIDQQKLRDAPLVVAVDYGIKRNILRRLVATGVQGEGAASFGDRGRDRVSQSGRRFSFQRSGRPGRAALCLRCGPRRDRQKTPVRNLPRPSDTGAGAGRRNLQARISAITARIIR